MAYSTGSGDYVALMAAVLAHAVADGWVEAGGIGTGWPISSGIVNGVDWDSVTDTETDFTGTLNNPITTRYLNLAIGTSTANATANVVALDVAEGANFHYTFTAWHIFSDPTNVDYVHVVYQFTNGFGNSDCFGRFGFGEMQLDGMTHTGIAWAGASRTKGWAAGTVNGSWNSLDELDCYCSGAVGESDDGSSQTQMILDSTTPPTPVTGGWPQPDVLFQNGLGQWQMSRFNNTATLPNDQGQQRSLNSWAMAGVNQPFSGAITLGIMPCVLINGTTSAANNMWVGVYPDVRMCRMDNYNPGDEVTFSGDIWKIFPMVRNQPDATLSDARVVTSGRVAYAYKKVV